MESEETEQVNVTAKRAKVTTNYLKVTKEKEPPRREEVREPLTEAQRKKLRKLIDDWVTQSNVAKRPLYYPQAWARLYNDCLDGAVNGIGQIEQGEFERCVAYINQKLAIIMDNKNVRKKYGGNRNKYISAIQARCKQNGVSEQTRKAYMLARFGQDSLTELSDDDLFTFYRYAMSSPPPKWTMPPQEIPGLQAQREEALAGFIDAWEQESGAPVARQALRYPGGKKAIMQALEAREPTLFKDITQASFNKFWSKQKVCKARR